MQYGVGRWNRKGLGNHRAVLDVAEPADAVWAHIPWRRRDRDADRKAVLVFSAATNERVLNVARIDVNREFGDLVFQATEAGTYYAYFLPFTQKDGHWVDRCFPNIDYVPPEDTADDAWLGRHALRPDQLLDGDWMDLPHARVTEIQAVNAFHRFDPMEIVASTEEVDDLLAHYADRSYLVFPEDRRYPIRMNDDLPLRWIEDGPHNTFHGEACRGEFYAFQLGLFAARRDIADLAVDVGDLHDEHGSVVTAAECRCINLGGLDWVGRPFCKTVSVAQGRVQPLWFGVQIPEDAKPGHYETTVTLRPDDAEPTTVRVSLVVGDRTIANDGADELQRMARLKWLDSTIGLDDEVLEPFAPVDVDGRTIKVLGRELDVGDDGLPAAVRSTFAPTVDRTDAPPRDLLAGPMQFEVSAEGGPLAWSGAGPQFVLHATGAAAWEATSAADGLELHTWARMECDGYVNVRLTLRATQAATLQDIALDIPLRREACAYFAGLEQKGGRRPAEVDWTWKPESASNQFWIGDVNAGLCVRLKHVTDDWPMENFGRTGLYRDWSNGGRGTCTLREQGDVVRVRAGTGERTVAAGDELHFHFGFLITPTKTLDQRHWQWRYVHRDKAHSVKENAASGAKLINIHHGERLHPHINYPFLSIDRLSAYIAEAHEHGMKVKVYYTVRELSNHVREIWALRSLGDEVFADGPGVSGRPFAEHVGKYRRHSGDSWLCEHLIDGYLAAWHQDLGDAHCDAAIETVGLSRWHNYYLEGLRWMLRTLGADGLYLDGIGYDREIMKRLRKVMQRAKPGCLIDFHSGNGYSPENGLRNSIVVNAEHLPYVDSIWFGEGFDYDEPPDYWLVEMAGIPFGLFGEMLQGGGNPWRGMLYGMTNRLGWFDCRGNPADLWALWDAFGIDEADMIGYWVPDCPVRTDHPDVLATVYRRDGRSLVSVASWAKEAVACTLTFDWDALGLDPQRAQITAPAVPEFQDAATFGIDDAIPVEPGRGWLLVVEG